MTSRFIIILSALLSALFASAQELQLTDFQETMEPDAVRFRVDDANGVACALVKIGLIAKDPIFSGSVQSDYKEGEYWVYVPEGTENLLVKTSNFVPFTLDFGKPLQSLFTYRATVQPKAGGVAAKAASPASGGDRMTVDIPGTSCSYNLILVKPGMFEMGATPEQESKEEDEKPVHWVKISTPYYIGETEVTQALWEAVMKSNPSTFVDGSNPVEGISWADAQRFINRLNSMTGLEFSMPTEAQWEYAARGGHKGMMRRFSGSDDVNTVGWHKANSGNRLHGVKELEPNEIGIYDMSGNVWEFCFDYKQPYSDETQTDPVQTRKNENRVRRGGSWNSAPEELRNAYRRRTLEKAPMPDTGLRLVLVKQ